MSIFKIQYLVTCTKGPNLKAEINPKACILLLHQSKIIYKTFMMDKLRIVYSLVKMYHAVEVTLFKEIEYEDEHHAITKAHL
jgi:hypothetical protein